jgi:hypothetical protein
MREGRWKPSDSSIALGTATNEPSTSATPRRMRERHLPRSRSGPHHQPLSGRQKENQGLLAD